MTLPQLYDLLKLVDWHYMMADDPRAYRAGQAGWRHARGCAEALGEPGTELFTRFASHHQVSGGERSPLPPRPVE